MKRQIVMVLWVSLLVGLVSLAVGFVFGIYYGGGC